MFLIGDNAHRVVGAVVALLRIKRVPVKRALGANWVLCRLIRLCPFPPEAPPHNADHSKGINLVAEVVLERSIELIEPETCPYPKVTQVKALPIVHHLLHAYQVHFL